MEKTGHSGINVSEDEFTVMQPSDDLNAAIVTAENSTGDRPANAKVADTAVILERQEGTLDVFKQKVGDKTPQESCKEKPVISSDKGYYIIREDTCNVGFYVFSENKVLFKGYSNMIKAALSSLVTNPSPVDKTWIMNLKSYKKSILETKEQVISDIKQYSIEQAFNPLDDLEEDELFN